jgi:cytochrome c oxidase subunit 2
MSLWLPEAASSYAGEIDGLLVLITVIVGVWFLAAEGVLIYFALRYRRVEGRKAAYVPARTLRTMSFVLVPCAVVLGFDLVIDAAGAPVWDHVKQELPPADERVRIVGEQWAWRFTYPGADGLLDTEDDVEVINELHALWVPELRLKQDAVPGRTIRGWFKATREGSYEFICAEICGIGHTMMKAMLHVESPDAYRRWMQSKQTAAMAALEKERG